MSQQLLTNNNTDWPVASGSNFQNFQSAPQIISQWSSEKCGGCFPQGFARSVALYSCTFWRFLFVLQRGLGQPYFHVNSLENEVPTFFLPVRK